MNRLLALTALAVVAVAMSGCSRPWTSWLNRGAECDACPTAPMVDSFEAAPGTFAPTINSVEQLPVPPG